MARRTTVRDGVGVERLQLQDQRPRQQRCDHGERRVLGGGRDQQHDPVLDGGQQRVLLGLGEPVHLVDEQHGLLAVRGGARATSMTARTSLTPADSADSASNRRPVACEISDASVVLPVPGGP